MADQISRLESRMAKASEDGDFEAAALLRDAIARLRSGESGLREQEPGRMGLGTSQEDYLPTSSGPLPRKPDPLVSHHRPAGRRRR